MKHTKEKNKLEFGTGGMIILSAVYIAFGLLMLLVPGIEEVYIIYVLSIVLIGFGLFLAVRYFLSGLYRRFGNFSFSLGILAAAGGICLLIRADTVASFFNLFLGICILMTAVIKLQNAVALSTMKYPYWAFFFVLSLVFLAAAMIIILNPMEVYSEYLDIVYYILIADGAVDLFSTLFMKYALNRFEHGGFHIPSGRKDQMHPDGNDHISSEYTESPRRTREQTGYEEAEEGPSEVQQKAEEGALPEEDILRAMMGKEVTDSKKTN